MKSVACGYRGQDGSFTLGDAVAPSLRAGSVPVLCGTPSHVSNVHKLGDREQTSAIQLPHGPSGGD